MEKLILGTAQVGLNYGINNSVGKISYRESFDIFNFSNKCGIQFLDTAPVYGNAHQVIGDFHSLFPRKRFKIISKIPAGFSVEKLEKLVDNFLIEMNVGQLDVLLFHSVGDYLKADAKKLKNVVCMLKEKNIVKSFGVSIYENSDVVNIDENIINVVQLPFNLLDNVNLRGEVIKSLKDKNIQVHIRSVFLQGLFFKDLENLREGEIKRALSYIREVCESYSISIENLALNYCLMQSDIDKVLIGVDGLAQLQRNIQLKSDIIPNACFDAINKIFIENPNEINPSKW